VTIQAGFIYIVIILFVQWPLRENDGCGKTIKAGTMDRGSTVYINWFSCTAISKFIWINNINSHNVRVNAKILYIQQDMAYIFWHTNCAMNYVINCNKAQLRLITSAHLWLYVCPTTRIPRKMIVFCATEFWVIFID